MRRFSQPRASKDSDVDMTPLIDVVFQLLLFFILTSAVTQTALQVNLPDSVSSEKSPEREADLVISVNADERIFLNETPATLPEVKTAIRALLDKNPDASVILNADRKMPYGIFFQVIEAATESGVKHLNLAYTEETAK
jgi:biopolymer transport protein ExbD